MTGTRSLVFQCLLTAAIALAVGCGGAATVDSKQITTSYVSLKDAQDAFAAKKYGEAIPKFDAVIAAGLVQADVLGETYLKRAICKMETGDKPGARTDLAKAEEGGAVGQEYQDAQKRVAAD